MKNKYDNLFDCTKNLYYIFIFLTSIIKIIFNVKKFVNENEDYSLSLPWRNDRVFYESIVRYHQFISFEKDKKERNRSIQFSNIYFKEEVIHF